VNVLKCIFLVQKVGFLKYKSGLLHGYKMTILHILKHFTHFTTGQAMYYNVMLRRFGGNTVVLGKQ